MNIIGKAMSLAISLAVASAAFGAELSKSVPKGWDEDFEAGKATAEKSGKLILLAFSGLVRLVRQDGKGNLLRQELHRGGQEEIRPSHDRQPAEQVDTLAARRKTER